MSEITLNLSDYKSSGVYFVEIDNSISTGSANAAIRLAVGYNEEGIFNRPIYMSSTADCDELLGGINRTLERRGCYTNRNVRTMVKKAPVYVLNLLAVDTKDVDTNQDTVGFNAVSFDAAKGNIEGTTLFANMFDRTKFWIADPAALMNAVASKKYEDSIHAPLFAFGNSGTKDISLIVRKAENLTGYNVTFLDWYGKEDDIPYKWINPYDYVSDYFVQVIAVAGNFSDSNYATYAADSVWSTYFTKDGIKKDKLAKFLRLDAVTVLGNWTGCIIPDFYDKQGQCRSIDYLINKSVNKTGLMFGVNTEALDLLTLNKKADVSTGTANFFLDYDGDLDDDGVAENAPFAIDMVGINLTSTTGAAAKDVKFMSYDISSDIISNSIYKYPAKINLSDTEACTFTCDCLDANSGTAPLPAVGDYVRAKDGTLTRIIKKKAIQVEEVTLTETVVVENASEGEPTEKVVETVIPSHVEYTYTTLSPIFAFGANDVESALGVLDDPNIDNSTETEPENLGYQDYMVFGTNDDRVGEDGTMSAITVEIHKSIFNLYETLKFIPLAGLKVANRHRPGFDKDGNMDIEAGVEKIYNMLNDEGIRKGLLNNEMIDFRYIVDTMAGGLGESCKAKRHLSILAQEKGSCTALINLPSMTDFAKSTLPYFCNEFLEGDEDKPTFDIAYIPKGGNQDQSYKASYELFTLPNEEEGSKFAAFFSPYLKYVDGARTILVPPAADVCNTFMNKYLGGDPYKTVANLNGVINNSSVVGLEYDFDRHDRDALEPFGVNPIITRGGVNMIYGDRTAYQVVNSDFNFLHVRELLNTLEVRCRSILNDYIFTYNNAATRAEIYTRLDPILRSMKDSRALAKYEIQIDEINNTQEIIDAKMCIVDIGVWVTPNMEKIVTRLTVNRGSAA